jgi:hypothetical protein
MARTCYRRTGSVRTQKQDKTRDQEIRRIQALLIS